MKKLLLTGILLIALGTWFGQAQKQRITEVPFVADNGFIGTALLETTNYVENTHKLKVALLQLQITGYKTSIGFFEGNDLEERGYTFPFECHDCSFSFSSEVGMQSRHLKKWVQVPIKTLNTLSMENTIILSIPFLNPEETHQPQQTIIDWETTGKLMNTKVTDLKGETLTGINKQVKIMAKANIDKTRLATLRSELAGLDKTAQLQRLYQNRSSFYDKQAIDSLIFSVKYEKRIVAENPSPSEKNAQKVKQDGYRIAETAKNSSLSNNEGEEKNRMAIPTTKTVETTTAKTSEVAINTEIKTISDSSLANANLSLPAVKKNQTSPISENEISGPQNQNLEGAASSSAPSQLVQESQAGENSETLAKIVEEEKSTNLSQIAGTNTSAVVEAPVRRKPKKLSKLNESDFDFTSDLKKYKRSSLHTIMLRNPKAEQANVIEETFLNRPLPEKFNAHHINTNFISVEKKARKQEKVISDYLERNNIAKELISKWFNRNEKGEFNMDLVAERGHYNATIFDLNIARKSERGLAMLADAGEQLIANTFVIVNDYKYTNKEEVAKKTGLFSSILSAVATAAGADDVALIADATTVATGVAGKGYVVKVTSYLYRLKWNEKIANEFYEKYWVDANNFDPSKKHGFDHTDMFEMEFMGYETDFSATQSTIFTSKTDAELIQRATIKATDQTIAKLQRKFQAFRTVSPLVSTEPLAAKIGLKEGVEKGDKFEVLEQFLKKDGTIGLNRIGVIKVDKNQIWDNRYRADYEDKNSTMDFTTFMGSNNKFYEGMLIRQIN